MTIRDNILFHQTMDKGRYNVVVDACALRADFQLFTGGDLVEIGERVSVFKRHATCTM